MNIINKLKSHATRRHSLESLLKHYEPVSSTNNYSTLDCTQCGALLLKSSKHRKLYSSVFSGFNKRGTSSIITDADTGFSTSKFPLLNIFYTNIRAIINIMCLIAIEKMIRLWSRDVYFTILPFFIFSFAKDII